LRRFITAAPVATRCGLVGHNFLHATGVPTVLG
jgi:hypothetical protein